MITNIVYLLMGFFFGILLMSLFEPIMLPECDFVSTEDGDWFALSIPCIYEPY